MKIDKIIKINKFVITEHLINISLVNQLSLTEFIVLIYLDNNYQNLFDPILMSKILNLDTAIIMNTLNDLINKKLISLNTIKDENNKYTETVELDGIYSQISEELNNEISETTQVSVYMTFEKEFGRPLSSIEIEIIKNWLDNGTTEELVTAALKQAVHSGGFNIRYIDKIITDWNKKNYKSVKDLSISKQKENEEIEQQELFDYDWTTDYE